MTMVQDILKQTGLKNTDQLIATLWDSITDLKAQVKSAKKKERTRVLAELFDMVDVYTYKYEGRTYLMMTEFESVIDKLIKGD